MLNTKPPPVSPATITEFFKIAEFMQDKKAVSAALAQEAQEAAAKMEQARFLEREAAVRVEALQRKANSLAKREAELHRREAAALDEEETGPRLLTFADAIGEIAEAIGRRIRYKEILAEEYASLLEKYKVPSEYVSLVMYLFTTVLDGRNESLTDGVQCALGREPRDFAEYAWETAATGVWAIR